MGAQRQAAYRSPAIKKQTSFPETKIPKKKMTYLYENLTFDFEHSSIKCKILVFKCQANKLYSLSKNKRGKIFTHTRIFKGKAEIVRKGMHFHNTVTQ